MASRSSFYVVAITLASTFAALIPFDSWEHQRVPLEDVNIHFRYAGKGPPLMLVHGVPQHSVRNPFSSTHP